MQFSDRVYFRPNQNHKYGCCIFYENISLTQAPPSLFCHFHHNLTMQYSQTALQIHTIAQHWKLVGLMLVASHSKEYTKFSQCWKTKLTSSRKLLLVSCKCCKCFFVYIDCINVKNLKKKTDMMRFVLKVIIMVCKFFVFSLVGWKCYENDVIKGQRQRVTLYRI